MFTYLSIYTLYILVEVLEYSPSLVTIDTITLVNTPG